MNPRLLEFLRSHATITLVPHPEPSQIAGNVLASNDPEEERAAELEVAELAARTDWGWCRVHLRAECPSFPLALTGDVWLGRVSCESEEAFRAGPYFAGLLDDGLEDLAKELEVFPDTVERLLAWTRPTDAWTAVEDALPLMKRGRQWFTSDPVIVTGGYVQVFASLTAYPDPESPLYWRVDHEDGYRFDGVTHWRPAPCLPDGQPYTAD